MDYQFYLFCLIVFVIFIIPISLLFISEYLIDLITLKIKQSSKLNSNFELDQRNIYYQDAILALGENQYEQAVDFLTKSLSMDDKFAMALNVRGCLYQKINQYDRAINDYQKYLQLKPEDSKIRSNLAMAMFKNGQINDAKKEIENTIKQDPYLEEAYHNQGLIALHENNLEQARLSFDKVLEIPPHNPTDIISLALVDIYTQNYQDSIEKFTQLIELNKSNMDILYYRGYCHYKLGNHSQAQQDFAKADAILPHQPLLRYEDLSEDEIFSI